MIDTPEERVVEPEFNVSQSRGAFADALTLIRALLTPAIMLVIIIGWQADQISTQGAEYTVYPKMLGASLLASLLFGIAAITDALDDAIGGAETSALRRFGWFDDAADLILIIGTLLALLFVTWKSGALGLGFAIPAIVIIAREAIVGLTKGYELTREGWPQTVWSTAKNALAMVSTLLLVASPWLTNWIDQFRANSEAVMDVFVAPSTYVWTAGVIGLWITAILSVVTGIMILTRKST